jgi:microcystin degradation protein MlrC
MTSVLIAGFKHETNTFSALPTDLEAYKARALYHNDEVPKQLRGTKTEPAAFLDFCNAQNWQVTHPVYADASPSGKVTALAFNHISGLIVDAAKSQPPDAVLLSLHGAMVMEDAEDGEGELLARLREQIGPDVPIAITLDLHANVTDRMAALADIVVAYRTYPHIDQYEIATQAAELIRRTLAGEIKPSTTVVRGQMLNGVDSGRTTAPGPMTEVLASADNLLSQPGVLSTSVCAGFAKADTHDTGPSAIVVSDGPAPRFTEMADGLIEEVWQSRHRKTVQTVSIEDAVGWAKNAPPADGPVVLADFADNPGGGGYGDATRLLKAMIDADLQDTAFATIYDPVVAQMCWDDGLGALMHLNLGGKIDPAYGAPIEVRGKVTALTQGRFSLKGPMMGGQRIDMGPTAVLTVGGIEIVVTSGRFQAYDRMYFEHARIDPEKKKVLAVKSSQHFRAAFGPIASEIIVVDGGGGLTSGDYRQLSYENLRRPVYPLDLD